MTENTEYKNMMKKLDQLLKDATAVKEKATARDKEIDGFYDNVVGEMFMFRQVINDCLDELQKEIEAEADTKKTIDKQIVRTVLGTCSSVASDISNLQTSLKNLKSAKQTDQLGTAIKEAKSIIKSDTIRNTEELLEKTDKQFKFERNTDLLDSLSLPNIFGKLTLHSLVFKPKKMRVFDKIEQQTEISTKTKSDKVDCDIKGCAVLSASKLVLADWANKKVKILDCEIKKVIDEKEVEALPSDVAILPENKIAVPLPGIRVLLIMSTASKLSIVQRVPIRGECTAVTYKEYFLYVLCRSPKFIYMLDTQGEVQKTITLDGDVFSDLSNLTITEDSRYLYVSDFEKNCVASLTLQGEVSAMYKQKEFSKPRGIMVLEDGAVLVCCWNGTVYHLSGDLKQGHKIMSGYKYLRSICYNHEHNLFYIGSWTDQLRVFKA